MKIGIFLQDLKDLTQDLKKAEGFLICLSGKI